MMRGHEGEAEGLGRDLRLAPLMKDTLGNRAYEQIRTALMASRFKPGEKLVLRPLAAEFRISPTPVREALLRLVSEHALTLNHRGIVCVPRIDIPSYMEVRDLRIDLEGRAASVAATHVTCGDIVALERDHAAFEDAECRQEITAALEANERFHMRLYALAEMPVLLSLIEKLWLQWCGPIFTRLYENPLPTDGNRHSIILDGLKRRDSEMVKHGIRDDIMAGWKVISRVA